MYATRRDTLAAGDPGRDPARRKRRIATFGTISALTGVLIGTVGVPQAKASPADARAANAQFERTAGSGLGALGGGIACAITRNPGTCTADAGAWLVFFSQIESWHSYPYVGPGPNGLYSGKNGVSGGMR